MNIRHRTTGIGPWTTAGVFLLVVGSGVGTGVHADDVILVTGSRIERPEVQAASPIQTISEQDIQFTGATNAAQFLNELPQTLPGTFTSTTNNGGDGSTSVDLRGLGDERTLVLVDGKRFIPKDETGVVDLNAIPVAMIERVEVVTGGASAVYGSDAMAGVVNVILKKDFEGIEFGGQYETTDEWDGDTTDFNITMGASTADGRGNITAWATYTRRDGILSADRDYARVALGSSDDLGSLVPRGSPNAFPGSLAIDDDPDNPVLDFDGDGLVGFGPTGGVSDPATYYNYQAVNLLQVPQRRYTLGAIGRYEINPRAEAFTRIAYADNEVRQQLAPAATFFDQYYVNPDNPFVPAGTLGIISDTATAFGLGPDDDGNLPFFAGRRFLENGNRIEDTERSAFQIQVGLRGALTDNWDYETYVQRSQTDFKDNYRNDFNATRVQQALLAVDNGDGPECIDPSGGCAPLNIWWDDPTAITSEAISFIKMNMVATGRTQETVYGATASGDLGGYHLPWASSPIGLSVGYEYRETEARFDVDDNLATGNGPGFGLVPAVAGKFDVHELFVEANVPLVENRPGIYSLSLETGFRFSNYSTDVDTVETWKAGLAWAPVENIKFRGMFQRAVRAPNIEELFLPNRESAETVEEDPCAAGGAAVGDPTLTALCEATGVPVGLVGVIPQPPAGQVNAIQGGNVNLKEETADTWTLGLVWQPTPDLTLTLDYYDIEIEDAIDVLGGSAQSLLDGCYVDTLAAGSDFCQAVVRSPQGFLFGAESQLFILNDNLAFLNTSGIDGQVTWFMEPGFMPGSLSFNLTGTYVIENEFKADEITPLQKCAGAYGATCGQPDPEFRFNLRTTWNWDDLQLSLRIRWLDSLQLDALENGEAAYSASRKIASQTYFDLSGAYNVSEHVEVSAGVSNLFDNDPPVVDSDTVSTPTTGGNANTFPATYDPLGRVMFVAARVRF